MRAIHSQNISKVSGHIKLLAIIASYFVTSCGGGKTRNYRNIVDLFTGSVTDIFFARIYFESFDMSLIQVNIRHLFSWLSTRLNVNYNIFFLVSRTPHCEQECPSSRALKHQSKYGDKHSNKFNFVRFLYLCYMYGFKKYKHFIFGWAWFYNNVIFFLV